MSAVVDKDRGMKRIMENARRRFPRVYTVGVHDPKIAVYAIVHEMGTRFMRNAFERRLVTKLDDDLERLATAVAKGEDSKPEQFRVAEGFRIDYRKSVIDEKLIDTGALRDSMETVEEGSR